MKYFIVRSPTQLALKSYGNDSHLKPTLLDGDLEIFFSLFNQLPLLYSYFLDFLRLYSLLFTDLTSSYSAGVAATFDYPISASL